jgi:hypothetical protein
LKSENRDVRYAHRWLTHFVDPSDRGLIPARVTIRGRPPTRESDGVSTEWIEAAEHLVRTLLALAWSNARFRA